MKKTWVLFGWMLTASVVAQEQETTLLTPPVHQGLYGGSVLKFGTFGPENESSLIAGAQGGWIIDRRFVLGAAVYGLSTQVKAPELREIAGLVTVFNYGGLFLSYIHRSYSLVHGEATLILGGGQAFYRNPEYRLDRTKSDAFIVIEPGINAVLNILTGVRAGIGLSYRMVQRFNLQGMTAGDVAGANLNVVLQLGYF